MEQSSKTKFFFFFFLFFFFFFLFFCSLVGKKIELHDLKYADPDRYNSFEWMLKNKITGVIFQTFTVEIDSFGKKVVYELKKSENFSFFLSDFLF